MFFWGQSGPPPGRSRGTSARSRVWLKFVTFVLAVASPAGRALGIVQSLPDETRNS